MDLTPGLRFPGHHPHFPFGRTVLAAGAVGSRFFVREMPRCGIVGSPSIGHLG
jgi:hypothetical protein